MKQTSIEIDSPIDKVWSDISDIASHAQWMKDAHSITYVNSQTQREGTEFVCDTRVGPFRFNDPMVVTKWVEGSEMSIRHSGLITGEGTFHLKPLPGERTQFTWREQLNMPWWFGGALGALVVENVMAVIWRGNLRSLKARIESQ